jgi:hypothetical protein
MDPSASTHIHSCFINGPAPLIIAFTMNLDNFLPIHLQKEANCKLESNTISENQINVFDNSPVELSPPECTTHRRMTSYIRFNWAWLNTGLSFL